MKMAAGWHFAVKVCASAPLELQYVAYVCSKIELSGQNLLSVSHYHKSRQDSSIPLPGPCSPTHNSKGNTKIARKERQIKSDDVCNSCLNILFYLRKYPRYITALQIKAVNLRLGLKLQVIFDMITWWWHHLHRIEKCTYALTFNC